MDIPVLDTGESDGAGSTSLWRVLADQAVTVLFVVLIVATYVQPSLAGEETDPSYQPLDVWWLLIGLAGAASLIVRKRYPLFTAVAVTIAVTLIAVVPYDVDPVAWMVYVAGFALGRYGSVPQSLIALGAFTVSTVVIGLSSPVLTLTGTIFAYGFLVLAWVAGRGVRSWRDRAEIEKADADRRVEMERQAVRLAETEERLNIAQELHDVIAHSMSVIAVQAGMADATFDSRPEEARQAVDNILRTSRSSLTEIRRIVGILRGDPHGRAEVASPPGLGDLPDLIASVERNGVEVVADVGSGCPGLPAGVELSTFRIVQEALTNVLEHAQAAHVSVTVVCDNGAVSVEVVDDGVGAAAEHDPRRTGYGLIGMRERVAAYGGTLDSGPLPGGGFRVTAVIPFEQIIGTGIAAS